ncbi:hypothetical protein OHV05_00295 [Kitasatospora sp. NBC_00070]|uniref:hypothetical protein n=1 Tax=Kitasatospora sp. NBC_00070 TaxID=2975962 RepID=UPI003247C92B
MTEHQDITEAHRGFRWTAWPLGALLLLALVVQLPPGQGGSAVDSRARDVAQLLWPQGWNLFDDGQYGPELVGYRAGPDGWRSAMVTPHGRPGTLWGADRSARTQIREIAALADLVPPDAWIDCAAATLADCHWPAPPEPRPMTSPSALPTLCGEVALTRETLGRWGTEPAGQWRIEAAVLLRVTCP